MKRLLLLIASLFTISSASAYVVTIQNTLDQDVKVKISYPGSLGNPIEVFVKSKNIASADTGRACFNHVIIKDSKDINIIARFPEKKSIGSPQICSNLNFVLEKPVGGDIKLIKK